MKRLINDKRYLYRIRVKQDATAFEEIYDEHVDAIYRFVLLKVSHKEDAEDVTADIFLKAWRYLNSEKAEHVKSIRGLLYSIARNSIVDLYRKRAYRADVPLDAATDVSGGDNIESSVATSIAHTRIIRVIRMLKHEYQEVVLLRYIEELSTREIAQIVGKSQSAVRVTLHRAMKKLKHLLDTNTTDAEHTTK